MLTELDQFIQFLIDHQSDDRVRISKKMKYGFRHYHLLFVIDDEPEESKNSNHPFLARFSGSVEIVFDNRNKCIDLFDHSSDEHIVIEDLELLEKWNDVLEQIVNVDIGVRVTRIMESALAACYRKDLHRIYKMKYLFDEEDDTKTDLDF
jgi:hypothetical protein